MRDFRRYHHYHDDDGTNEKLNVRALTRRANFTVGSREARENKRPGTVHLGRCPVLSRSYPLPVGDSGDEARSFNAELDCVAERLPANG
jgi:hypothetical protein